MTPFSKNRHETVAALGERQLIERIRQWLGDTCPASPEGIGDDCAVVPQALQGALCAIDPAIYGIHFDAAASPEAIGAKLLKRNLSDIAAMGGHPTTALFALAASSDLATAWLERFVTGLAHSARHYRTAIIGGDVSGLPSQGFVAQLAINGQAEKPLLRGQGRPGDSLWVTGTLGGSLLRKHLEFEPRLAEGQWLARHGAVRSLIDLTDGIAKDLPVLLSPGSCAIVQAEAIPLSAAARAVAASSGKTPLAHALSDGEDYELAFALDAAIAPEAFADAWGQAFALPVAHIGQVKSAEADQAGLLIDAYTGEVLASSGGYEHMREAP